MDMNSTMKSLERVGCDLSRMARRDPAPTLAIALGVGYVLGGGLLSRLTWRMLLRRALQAGLAFAVLPALRR
jgi:hypothetical protein